MSEALSAGVQELDLAEAWKAGQLDPAGLLLTEVQGMGITCGLYSDYIGVMGIIYGSYRDDMGVT